MNMNFLEFEQPIAELEAKIDELRYIGDDADVNIQDEVSKLEAKSKALTQSIFAGLTAWQISQLARHPQRPYTMDYLTRIFTDFQELLPGESVVTIPGASKASGKRRSCSRRQGAASAWAVMAKVSEGGGLCFR